MIGAPSEQSGRSPVYRVMRLYNHVVPPGWKAAGLGRAAGVGVIASKFEGPNQRQKAVVVLNNSAQQRQVRLEGLKPRRNCFRVAWNQDGKGALAALPRLASEKVCNGMLTLRQARKAELVCRRARLLLKRARRENGREAQLVRRRVARLPRARG